MYVYTYILKSFHLLYEYFHQDNVSYFIVIFFSKVKRIFNFLKQLN